MLANMLGNIVPTREKLHRGKTLKFVNKNKTLYEAWYDVYADTYNLRVTVLRRRPVSWQERSLLKLCYHMQQAAPLHDWH